MPKTIQQTVQFDNVSPQELFDTYLDSKKHAVAINAPATISKEVGGEFKIFGEDHLRGRNLAIIPSHMIVQSWRGMPWTADDLDSILVLTFSRTSNGAQINLVQANVPDQAYDQIKEGWDMYYWKPWKDYLSRKRSVVA